jgi:hypothetical protein
VVLAPCGRGASRRSRRRSIFSQALRAARATWLAIAAVAAATPGAAHAQDPRRAWRTLASEHFDVHFPEELRDTARHAAQVAERAYGVVTGLLDNTPRERVQLVLTDDVDGANGSASTLPYDVVTLLVGAPPAVSSLADYRDWMRLLIVHELTHIVHIDTVSGVPAALNLVLGKTWLPNGQWPRWFVEGLAVYMESTYSGDGGRVASSWTEMMLRASVLAGGPPDLPVLGGPTRQWPRGTLAYNFGGPFVSFLYAQCGQAGVRHMVHRYGGSAIPYAVSRTTAEGCAGVDLPSLYEAWREDVRARVREDVRRIEARGTTRYARLTGGGETRRRPRIVPGNVNDLVYLRDDGVRHAALVRRPVEGGLDAPETVVAEVSGWAGHDVLPDGSGLVVAQVDVRDDWLARRELFHITWDGRVRRLTEGARAEDPAVSPDGRLVAYVGHDAARTDLWLLDLTDGTRQRLTDLPAGARLEGPAFAPDGRRIAVSAHLPATGTRDVWLLDVAECREAPCARPGQALAVDAAQDLSPAFAADGRWLYYVSDEVGAYNVHAFDLRSMRKLQVSHVVTGVFDVIADVGNERIFGVVYGSDGFDLFVMRTEPYDFREIADVDIEAGSAAPVTWEPPSAPVSTLVDEAYSPWPTLWPRAWSPRFSATSLGETVGVLVEGGDVLDRHAWNALYEYATRDDEHAASLAWAMRLYGPRIGAAVGREVVVTGGQRRDGRTVPYREERISLRAQAAWPFVRTEQRHAVSLRWSSTWRRPRDAAPPLAPDQRPPVFAPRGWQNTATLAWSYSDARGYTFGVGASEGRRLSLDASYSGPELGSLARFTRATASWTEYLAPPWAATHALATQLAAGIGTGRDAGTLFALGGPPDRDLLFDLLFDTPITGTWVRGYPPGASAGDSFALLRAEYRAPIVDLDAGIDALPFFVRRLSGAAFVDTGAAYPRGVDLRRTLVGAGLELRAEVALGYDGASLLRLGYARGLRRGGIHDVFLLSGLTF